MQICHRQITVKNRQNLPISNLQLDLHNINTHAKFGENPLVFTQYCLEMKMWADNSVKNWRNLPISNPKPDLYNIKSTYQI